MNVLYLIRRIAVGIIIFALYVIPAIIAGVILGVMLAITAAWPNEEQRKRLQDI